MKTWNNRDLIFCNCNLCGSKKNQFIYERHDKLKVVRCKNCGLVYINPRPKDGLINLLYNDEYFEKDSQIGYNNYFSDSMRQSMVKASKLRLKILEDFGVNIFGKALEVGCATGEFCSILKKAGVEATGIDISSQAIEIAQSRYSGIPFHVATIDVVPENMKFNFIFAFEVIEHLIDPCAFFKKASDMLKLNGFLCITTPNFECAEIVGYENWTGFSMSLEHLYFFSKTTIEKYAEANGFELEISLFGGGSGIKNDKISGAKRRQFIRNILLKANLLSIARKAKDFVKPPKHGYQPDIIRHNLFVVLRKKIN